MPENGYFTDFLPENGNFTDFLQEIGNFHRLCAEKWQVSPIFGKQLAIFTYFMPKCLSFVDKNI
jgi:hypothetical protein